MPKKNEEYSEAEARRRFEQAVDKALRTPPVHREAKAPAKAKKTKPRG